MDPINIPLSELSDFNMEELRREWRERVANEQTELGFDAWLHKQLKPRKIRVMRTEERALDIVIHSHSVAAAIDWATEHAGDMDFTLADGDPEPEYDVELIPDHHE